MSVYMRSSREPMGAALVLSHNPAGIFLVEEMTDGDGDCFQRGLKLEPRELKRLINSLQELKEDLEASHGE